MSSRPSSSFKDALRLTRIPGGFDVDEPILGREPSGGSLGQSQDLPDAESPSSPSMLLEDTSSLHARGDGGSDGADHHDMDVSAEQEMHRKLMDFESSFLPVPSPTIGGGALNDRSITDKEIEREVLHSRSITHSHDG